MNAPKIDQETASQIVKNMINRGNTRPIMFFGKGGIGKTESIAAIADELNMGYVDIRLLLYTESDLKGVPFVNENHTATIWLQNDILPRVERDGERGILVFDEITSCAKSVRTAAYQLLNERRLGEYVLPEGWAMICLGNGENDGGQFNGMEANFANRCSVYEILPTVDSWKVWAMANNVNPLVIGFVSWKESYLHTMDPENDSEIVFASPRSWKAVSDILNHTEFDDDDMVLKSEIRANIGNRVGGEFLTFCGLSDKLINPSDILSGKTTKYPTNKKNKQEILHMTIQELVLSMGNVVRDYEENGGNIKQLAKDKDIFDKCVNGVKWILGLGSTELETMAIKDFISINPNTFASIMIDAKFTKACPELLEFTKENSMIFKKLA